MFVHGRSVSSRCKMFVCMWWEFGVNLAAAWAERGWLCGPSEAPQPTGALLGAGPYKGHQGSCSQRSFSWPHLAAYSPHKPNFTATGLWAHMRALLVVHQFNQVLHHKNTMCYWWCYMITLSFNIHILSSKTTSRASCKTIVTTLFYIRSYNSFPPSPRLGWNWWSFKVLFCITRSFWLCLSAWGLLQRLLNKL